MGNKSRLMTIEYEELGRLNDDIIFYPERLEGYQPPVKEVFEIPKVKSKWRHSNGLVYKVKLITNLDSTNGTYPITISYKGENGKLWSRPLGDWYRSFVKIND